MEHVLKKKNGAAAAPRPNRTGIPAQMKRDFEGRSGLSLDDVRVHYSSDKPARLGALAYTQGSQVYVGPGQQRHLPHELGHVIQQKRGLVRPTGTVNGLPVNESAGLEAQADRILQMKAAGPGFSGSVVQMKKEFEPEALDSFKQAFDTPASSQADNIRLRGGSQPVMANGRDLISDTINALNWEGRKGRAADEDMGLLDTTYDDVLQNVILDLHQMYEEYLQEEIEHDSVWVEELSKVASFIDRNLKFVSLGDMSQSTEPPQALRSRQVEHLWKFLGERGIDRNTTEVQLKGNGWDLKELPDYSGYTPELIAALKELKTIETQVPYFGGSVAYQKRERSFEALIYHMSTLTRDPARYYAADSLPGRLPKPLIDYVTHQHGLVPFQNQRNLAEGVTECEWDILPALLQRKIVEETGRRLADRRNKGFAALYNTWDKPAYAQMDYGQKLAAFAKHVWDRESETTKKAIYSDILQIPWSGLADPELPNVVGLSGNTLLRPEIAAESYGKMLQKSFPTGAIPPGAFPDYHGRGAPTVKEMAADFEQKHRDWHDYAMGNQLPIIGGISGHTLGYLNLYRSAREANPEAAAALPSMERMRFLMMGALIGTKRHHSYDEVMTASHMMPDGADKRVLLQYESKLHAGEHPYADVLFSGDAAVRNTARAALMKTLSAVKYAEAKPKFETLKSKSALAVLSTVCELLFERSDLSSLKTYKGELSKGYFNVLVYNDQQVLADTVNKLVPLYRRFVRPSKPIAHVTWATPYMPIPKAH